MTGFEYGMLGVGLFGSAYGLDQIGYITIVDLGHEIFIWFVFLALLLMRRDNLRVRGQLLRSFFRSPVIVAILLGLTLNLTGMGEVLSDYPVAGGLLLMFQFLGNLTVPVMLLIIGYSLRMDFSELKEALPVIFIRLAIFVLIAFLLGHFVMEEWLALEPDFERRYLRCSSFRRPLSFLCICARRRPTKGVTSTIPWQSTPSFQSWFLLFFLFSTSNFK